MTTSNIQCAYLSFISSVPICAKRAFKSGERYTPISTEIKKHYVEKCKAHPEYKGEIVICTDERCNFAESEYLSIQDCKYRE